jgi:hypothetical protein
MTARRPNLIEVWLSRSREVMNINLDINFLFTSSSQPVRKAALWVASATPVTGQGDR